MAAGKQGYDVTMTATVTRTITVWAWDVGEAEEQATEMFDAGINGDYDLGPIEVEEVTGSCDD